MTAAEAISSVAIDYAKRWKENNCKEVNNQSSCFQYLFSNQYKSVSGNPWCAATVSAVIYDACKKIGIQNPFHWTLSAWNLYEQAADMPNMRVDDVPQPGSVFVYPATSDYTAHTGIVVGTTKTGIYSVEGNSSDAIKCYGCPDNGVVVIGNTALRSHSQMRARGTVYIHTEDLGYGSKQTPMLAEAGMNPLAILLLVGVGVGLWYKS